MNIADDLKKAYEEGYANGLKDKQEWISVDERLPEPGKDVMTYDGFFMGVDFIYNDGTWSKQQRRIIRPITHWMPLPDAPKNP